MSVKMSKALPFFFLCFAFWLYLLRQSTDCLLVPSIFCLKDSLTFFVNSLCNQVQPAADS
jgi:hypothetical protein